MSWFWSQAFKRLQSRDNKNYTWTIVAVAMQQHFEFEIHVFGFLKKILKPRLKHLKKSMNCLLSALGSAPTKMKKKSICNFTIKRTWKSLWIFLCVAKSNDNRKDRRTDKVGYNWWSWSNCTFFLTNNGNVSRIA